MRTGTIRKLLPWASAFVAGLLLGTLFTSSSKLKIKEKDLNEEANQVSLRFGNGLAQAKLPPVRDSSKNPYVPTDWKEDDMLIFIREHGLVSNLPDNDTINTLSLLELVTMLHSYLSNSEILCHRKLRMGKVRDGGWDVCDDYEWRPEAPCLVYSFGINNDFSFDDTISNLYGCEVNAFDPSDKAPTHRRSERVMFYKYGLSGTSFTTDKGWILYPLHTLRKMLNHTDRVIDVLKMDIESAEWNALPTALQEKQLANVRQLVVEFHVWTKNDMEKLRMALGVLSGLEQQGFRKFYSHRNPSCEFNSTLLPVLVTKCYEVHYVNDRFRRGTESESL